MLVYVVIYFCMNVYRYFIYKNSNGAVMAWFEYVFNSSVFWQLPSYVGDFKRKNAILFLRLPVFFIDCNLNHIETFKYSFFFFEVNNKFIDFFFFGELFYSSCADAFDYQAWAPYVTISYIKYFLVYPSGCSISSYELSS